MAGSSLQHTFCRSSSLVALNFGGNPDASGPSSSLFCEGAPILLSRASQPKLLLPKTRTLDSSIARSRRNTGRGARAAANDQGSTEDLVKASTEEWRQRMEQADDQSMPSSDFSQREPVSEAPLLETPASIQEVADAAMEAHSEEAARKGALIHDFCFGIPYGAVLALGGVIWYVAKRRPVSLWHGLALGLVQLLLSAQSLKAWKKGASSSPYIVASLGIALFLTVTKGRAFAAGAPFLPFGLTALASILMALFFSYVLMAGGNPPPKGSKLATA